MATRAVLYYRLSSSTEVSTSIKRQRADLAALAEREAWEVVAEFTDDGISGKKTRANADAALALVRAGDADVLAVAKFDRWSRQGLGAVAALIDVLDERPSAKFVALADGLRSDQPAWRIIASVLAEVARMEADNTSYRIKSMQKRLTSERRFAGGRTPFGFKTAPNPDGPGRILTPNPTEAAVVREVAERILGGESRHQIVRDLNARQIPTGNSEARRAIIAGRDPDGLPIGSWYVSTLSTVWTGEVLAGRVIYDKRVVMDEHGVPLQVWEPVLDAGTLSRLQATLRDPRKHDRYGNERPVAVDRPQRHRASRLLSGVLFCAYCDRRLRVHSSNGKPTYRCATATEGLLCPSPRTLAEPIEAYVTKVYLAGASDLPETTIEQVVTDPGTADALAAVEDAIRDAGLALGADDADADALLRRLAGLKARRAELRSTPTSIEFEVRATGRTLGEAWAADEDVDRRRGLLLALMDHVTLASAEAKRTFDPRRVEIYWHQKAGEGLVDYLGDDERTRPAENWAGQL